MVQRRVYLSSGAWYVKHARHIAKTDQNTPPQSRTANDTQDERKPHSRTCIMPSRRRTRKSAGRNARSRQCIATDASTTDIIKQARDIMSCHTMLCHATPHHVNPSPQHKHHDVETHNMFDPFPAKAPPSQTPPQSVYDR